MIRKLLANSALFLALSGCYGEFNPETSGLNGTGDNTEDGDGDGDGDGDNTGDGDGDGDGDGEGDGDGDGDGEGDGDGDGDCASEGSVNFLPDDDKFGSLDQISEGSEKLLTSRESMGLRLAYEFPIPCMHPDSEIVKAELTLTRSFLSGSGNGVEIHGYEGDGEVEAADLLVSNVIAPSMDWAAQPSYTFSIRGYVKILHDVQASHIGIAVLTTASIWIELHSREATDDELRPYLHVEWE